VIRVRGSIGLEREKGRSHLLQSEAQLPTWKFCLELPFSGSHLPSCSEPIRPNLYFLSISDWEPALFVDWGNPVPPFGPTYAIGDLESLREPSLLQQGKNVVSLGVQVSSLVSPKGVFDLIVKGSLFAEG
jgi:hypothetical protein